MKAYIRFRSVRLRIGLIVARFTLSRERADLNHPVRKILQCLLETIDCEMLIKVRL